MILILIFGVCVCGNSVSEGGAQKGQKGRDALFNFSSLLFSIGGDRKFLREGDRLRYLFKMASWGLIGVPQPCSHARPRWNGSMV